MTAHRTKRVYRRVCVVLACLCVVTFTSCRQWEPGSERAKTEERAPANRAREKALLARNKVKHPGADMPVQTVYQLPDYPNGCEAASLTTVLQYLGYSVTLQDVVDRYLPREDFFWYDAQLYGPNPENAYAGNPGAGHTGYYCFEAPLAQAANTFLREQGEAYTARPIVGLTEEALLQLLDGGVPVIVWKTIDGEAPTLGENYTWYLHDTGEWYAPYTNVHVVVVRGYTDEAFLLCDPLGELESIPRADLLWQNHELGGRAVAILG